MHPIFARDVIESWRPTEVEGLELRRGFGVARPVPRHWHEEYQFCLIQAGSGEIHYRRDTHATPPASLFVVHPGEVHSNRAHDDAGCSYRTLFVPAPAMHSVQHDRDAASQSLPFFSPTVTFDPQIIRAYLHAHLAFENAASALSREHALAEFLSQMIERCADDARRTSVHNVARESINRARDYLVAHVVENVSLRTLANIAGASIFHFNRAFAQQFGMPPHAFQMQLRVHRAKQLLREGCPIAHAADACGFVDQSHLNRQFKRLTGISPGQFQNRKIVQDG